MGPFSYRRCAGCLRWCRPEAVPRPSQSSNRRTNANEEKTFKIISKKSSLKDFAANGRKLIIRSSLSETVSLPPVAPSCIACAELETETDYTGKPSGRDLNVMNFLEDLKDRG